MFGRMSRKSLFITLYGGILALVVVVALLGGSVLLVMGEWRERAHTERLATAIFHVSAVAVARQVPELRDLWLIDASNLLEAPLRLQRSLPFEPSVVEEKRLESGRAVVRQNGAVHDIFVRVPVSGETLYLTAPLEGFGLPQIRAAALFYLEDAANYPFEEPQRLAAMSRFIDLPLMWMPLGQVPLDASQRRRLARDEVVLQLQESRITGLAQLTVYAPSQTQAGAVMRLGPVPLFEALPRSSVFIVSVLALLLITLGAYGLISTLQRRLATLSSTVKKLESGDLSVRMVVESEDEVDLLGLAVNRMAAQIERLLAVQRELTQAVSHELRTPLARLRFGLDMLADTDDLDDRLRQREQLDEDIGQLNALIDEILTYAALEQGTPQLDFERVELDELLARMARETKALNKPIPLRIEADQGLVVEAVPRYLHRVMQNLVGNALRYANSQVVLRFEVVQDMATLTVEDDGPGIPEEKWKTVFEPFTRLDDSRTRSTGGYGLGLSIVNRIAYWFQGTIRVSRSLQLGGAAFIMRWPVRQPKRLTTDPLR